MFQHHLLAHLPYLAALYREQSFTKAAASLHVSQTAMSYQIKHLEAKLGCTLVVRQSGAKMRFSADGEKLVSEYLACEQRLGLVMQALLHTQGRGTVRLSTPIDFGSIVMPKLIAVVERLAPRLDVELHSSDETVDLERHRWDIAIRGSIDPVEDALFISPLYLVASKTYVESHGMPATLDEIGKHRILVRQASKGRSWSMLLKAQPQFDKQLTLGNTLGMREAAVEGLGIALLPEFVAVQEIKQGRLLTVLPETTSQLKVHFYIRRIATEQTQSYEALLRRAFTQVSL